MRSARGGWRWALVSAGAFACEGPTAETVGGCAPDDLAGCEYASPELAFTERVAQVTDRVTGRVLPLTIRVPDGPGPFGVVVYAHGGGLDDAGHRLGGRWGEALASHGYVTANIGHVTLGAGEAQTFCDLGAVPEGECGAELLGEDSGMVALVKRRDVIGVLDALPALAASDAAEDGPEVDFDRLAVIGWSAGSRATLATRGMAFQPSPSAPRYSESDDRIRAIVGFSPTGPGFGTLFADEDGSSWDTLDGPTLMATGENDVKEVSPDLTGAVRRQAFELQPADGQRRLLYSHLPVGTGGHSTYDLADLGSTDPSLDRLSLALRAAVRAFLDDTLAGDPEAGAWLASENARVLAGEADWEVR